MNDLKAYLYGLIAVFPLAFVRAGRHGWRGCYLVFFALFFRRIPFPVMLPCLGKVGCLAEVTNIIDNLYLKELRDDVIEKALEEAVAPVVVDIGVNVGVSVRWWLSWNPNGRVIAIDMMDEALSFTRERVGKVNRENHFRSVCVAVGEVDAQQEIWFDHSLEGTSSLLAKKGRQHRFVPIRTLDGIFREMKEEEILLLKIDIEGYAGMALRQAKEVLAKCRYAVVEIHGREETRETSARLHEAGFELMHFKGRQMWWSNAAFEPK